MTDSDLEELALKLAAEIYDGPLTGGAAVRMREFARRFGKEVAKQYASEAHEDVADWGAYASEYFQGKYDFAACLAKWEARMK